MSRRPKAEKNEKKQIKYFDYTLLFIIIFLVGFGDRKSTRLNSSHR